MQTPFPHKIISGGQTGADRAGLDYAIASGLEHGGYCPRGRRSEDGVVPAKYQLTETTDWKYRTRTVLNVREADATIIFNPGKELSSGCALTLNAARAEGRPFLLLKDFTLNEPTCLERQAAALVGFLARYRPAVLNVAGNREETAPGISNHVIGTIGLARELARKGAGMQPSGDDLTPLLPSHEAGPRQGQLAL